MKRLACVLALALTLPALAEPVLESEQDHVVVHAIGRELLAGDLTARAEIKNDGYGRNGYSNPNVAWMRDRFPFQARTRDGRLVVISYLSLLEPGGSPYDGAHYLPVPPPGPGMKPFKFGDGSNRWMEVRALPLLIEGGNVLRLADRLLVGEKVIRENAMSIEEHLAKAPPSTRQEMATRLRGMAQHGFRKRTADETRHELAMAFEIPAANVHVMPWMPGERTGHVDCYVGVLDGRTVAVPRVGQKLTNDLGYEHERGFTCRLDLWLDTRAVELARLGLKVVRLPMLPPKNLVPSALSEFGYDAQFLTPVNWLLSRGVAYVPVFPQWMAHLPPGEADAMNAEWTRVLAEHGHRMVPVPATKLLEYNGLVHCLTGQLLTPP